MSSSYANVACGFGFNDGPDGVNLIAKQVFYRFNIMKSTTSSAITGCMADTCSISAIGAQDQCFPSGDPYPGNPIHHDCSP